MSTERRHSRKTIAAFVLVELITCICVVLLLLALVVSAHGKPRSRVFLATDLSSHHLLLQGVASFANDNNDLLPNPGWGTAQINWACGSNCPAPAYASGNFDLYNFYYPQQLASLTNGQIFPYVRDPLIYRCPADSPANPDRKSVV